MQIGRLMFNMNAPFLKSLGLDAVWSGTMSGTGTAAQIVGTLMGGATVARFGLHRSLVPIAVARAAIKAQRANRPLEEWERRALAAGWKPPKESR